MMFREQRYNNFILLPNISNIIMAKTYQEINAYREKNEQFLEENAQNPDIGILPSGVQYQILKAGKGARPSGKDKVQVHYCGKLINGKEFDNSFKRKKPEIFRVNQLIKGFQEALKAMNVGSRWIVWIPYPLGYGASDCGRDIPAYSTLVFEIELLDIKK